MAEVVHDPPAPPWTPVTPEGPALDPALGGPLWVSPPVTPGPGTGVVRVATDALLAHAERLSRLREALESDARAVLRLPAGVAAGASPAAAEAARELGTAEVLTRAAAQEAVKADDALRSALLRYAELEAEQVRREQSLGAALGMLLGPALRLLALMAVPAALAATATGLPTDGQLDVIRRWMLDHPGLITSPGFVDAVRAGVMSVDEAVGSAAGLPPGVLQGLGAAVGFPGVQAGAILLLAAAQPFGIFRETSVSVRQVGSFPAPDGPRGAVERLARVPEGDQVRVERYEAPGVPPRYVVYVGPTETFSPVADTEPWDLTSNVTGVAGLSAGSLRATVAAMQDAGIGEGDPVQFVGFSQGGLVAARLAGSGDWNVQGLETYAAPSGNIALPPGLAGMAVRNTDDFVPALAGPQIDHHLLQIERQAFAEGSPMPEGLAAPAHQRSAYVAAATEIDAARSEAVREQIAAMDAFTAEYTGREGSRVTVMMYHADRM
jgi:hypothetical protein